MMAGSATVSVGERVSGGQALGKVGNSGNTTEPHLHFHFMDRWDGLDPVLSVFTSQGLPAVFGRVHVRRGDRTFRLDGEAPLGQDLVEP
jgi:murein DD-endopeptidase MepM/ murein hydrolase activator NlpD